MCCLTDALGDLPGLSIDRSTCLQHRFIGPRKVDVKHRRAHHTLNFQGGQSCFARTAAQLGQRLR